MISGRRFKKSLLQLFLTLWAGSYLAGADQSYVVLVSIDGFAAYHLENEKLELPNIRALASEGVWAESGETVFPSVTHPSHATIITGVSPRIHGVIGNTLRNRETGQSFSVTEKSHEVIEVSTLFDAAKRRGLTTVAMFWPETKGDPSVDFNPGKLPQFQAEGHVIVNGHVRIKSVILKHHSNIAFGRGYRVYVMPINRYTPFIWLF